MLTLDIERDGGQSAPLNEALEAAVRAALAVAGEPAEAGAACEMSLRIVDPQTMRDLNRRYRDRDKPTNVLSFPADLPADIPFRHLGDVIVCGPVVNEEAVAQGKPVPAHWAHMLVHGTLHLLGYDHVEASEARRMEILEARALATLGWPCPYEAVDDTVAEALP
jgi:probable rRNA maturation factor